MTKKRETITLLAAFACVFFLTFAQMSGARLIIFAALFLYLAILVLAKEEYVIPLMLFFLPWSTILKLSPESISFCSIGLLLIFVLHALFKSERKFSATTVVSVLGIVVVTMASSFINDYGISASYIMFVAMLVAYPLFVYWMRDRVNFETCIHYYSLGIISATVVAFAFGENANLLSYIKIFSDNANIERHCGFYGDPNFYAAQVVSAIGGQLLIINKKNGKTIWNAILTLVLVVCGATSVSKSYLLCFTMVFTAWIYCQIKNGAAKIIKAILCVCLVVVVVLASGAFSDIIDQYLFRFGSADDTASLTTGRSELWMEYIRFFINNPIDFLIGQGYTSVFKEGVHKGSHNTVIQCIYQLGLVGSVFFLWWVVNLVNSVKSGKVKFSYVLLLLISCFSMWMGLDMMFFDDLFLTIVVFAFGLKYAHSRAEGLL